jgi:hypothetical protein
MWGVYPLVILSRENDFKRGELVSVFVSRLEYTPVGKTEHEMGVRPSGRQGAT